jgi:hypothetical protein
VAGCTLFAGIFSLALLLLLLLIVVGAVHAGEDGTDLLMCGEGKLDLEVDLSGTNRSRFQLLGVVGGHDQNSTLQRCWKLLDHDSASQTYFMRCGTVNDIKETCQRDNLALFMLLALFRSSTIDAFRGARNLSEPPQ